MRVPPLETARLVIRELGLDDLVAVHQLLDDEPATTIAREPVAVPDELPAVVGVDDAQLRATGEPGNRRTASARSS